MRQEKTEKVFDLKGNICHPRPRRFFGSEEFGEVDEAELSLELVGITEMRRELRLLDEGKTCRGSVPRIRRACRVLNLISVGCLRPRDIWDVVSMWLQLAQRFHMRHMRARIEGRLE